MKDKIVAQQWDQDLEEWVDIIAVNDDNPHGKNIVTDVAKTFKMQKKDRDMRIVARTFTDTLVEELD